MPNTIPAGAMSERMRLTIDYACKAEQDKKHEFGISHDATGLGIREAVSPRLSDARQYYLTCIRGSCGRVVFENGTGSAAQSSCVGR